MNISGLVEEFDVFYSEPEHSEPTPVQIENRGLVWLIGAFLICPCHLPLTLALLGMLVSGTAAATLVNDHLNLAGAVVVFVWLAATLRGVVLVRSARRRDSSRVDSPAADFSR